MTTEQLALLPQLPATVPEAGATAGLRIPDRARRLGLAGVAQARRVLEEASRLRAEREALEAAERHAAAELAALERTGRRLAERSAA